MVQRVAVRLVREWEQVPQPARVLGQVPELVLVLVLEQQQARVQELERVLERQLHQLHRRRR